MPRPMIYASAGTSRVAPINMPLEMAMARQPFHQSLTVDLDGFSDLSALCVSGRPRRSTLPALMATISGACATALIQTPDLKIAGAAFTGYGICMWLKAMQPARHLRGVIRRYSEFLENGCYQVAGAGQKIRLNDPALKVIAQWARFKGIYGDGVELHSRLIGFYAGEVHVIDVDVTPLPDPAFRPDLNVMGSVLKAEPDTFMLGTSSQAKAVRSAISAFQASAGQTACQADTNNDHWPSGCWR